MAPTLFIRADASVSIGTGHIMRMIALGQAWQEQGGKVLFICAEITAALILRLEVEGFRCSRIQAAPGSGEDLVQTLECMAETPQSSRESARVVLDGYHFGSDYQLGIREAGFKFLVVDDYGHADFYHANWVLNQNISARESLYSRRSPETQLLLGPKFAMLRKEFLAYKGWKRVVPAVARKILVTLGGSDPDNVTLKVIQSLVDLDLHAKIVIGGSNPHLSEIENFIRNLENSGSKLEIIVDATNMPELMAWADIAVAGGGSTIWELAFMELPSLILVLAENQISVVEVLQKKMFIALAVSEKNFISNLRSSVERMALYLSHRNKISENCCNLTDGFGVKRITARVGADFIVLRRVNTGDFKLLLEWANDPVVRLFSFESGSISWENHLNWCNEKIADRCCFFYLASFGSGSPFAQVRFDVKNEDATVSIGLVSSVRGIGLGSNVLERAISRFFNDSTASKIHAFIKPVNHASIGAFEAAGFSWFEETRYKSQPAFHYVFEKVLKG